MISEHEKIIQRYPTEKHKRFFFPIRPLFTLGSGIFFGALFLLNMMPAAWAIIFTAAFAWDDLPLAPFIKLIRATNNLANGRKQLKSIVMITSITLSALLSGAFALLVLAHSPLFMFAISSFVFGTGCSPIFLFLGGVLGAMIADRTGQVTPLFGIGMGIGMGFLMGVSLPVSIIPLMASTVFVATITGAFIGSVIAKQSLRLYFYCKYGHSNADGYNMDRSPEEQEQFVHTQAEKFSVSKATFKNLIEHCKTKIADIKENASLMHAIKETSFSNPFAIILWCWDEFTLKRNYQSNAYKDIYHGLMAKETPPETVATVQALLKDSKPSEYNNKKERAHYPYIFSGKRESDLQARTFFHQCNLADTGGIPEALIEPFLNNTV